MITSRDNRKLKDMRQLVRSKTDRALLEGPHLVGAAIDAGKSLEAVFATPEFLQRPEGQLLLARLPSPPIEVAEPLLDEIADADSPRGLLAICELPRSGVESLPVQVEGIYLYASALQDPGNLGSIARAAEAAGATGLALGEGSAHPNHPRALRASTGSLLRLPVARNVGVEQLQSHLESMSTTWLALDSGEGASIHEVTTTGGLVLMTGSEGAGLPSEALAAADLKVSIPMAKPVESLNVVTAAAIALFEFRRRRSAEVTRRA